MLNLASARRIEAADKLLKDFAAASIENCFSPGNHQTEDWLWKARKALLDILTGEAKMTVPAPKLSDYNPEREAA